MKKILLTSALIISALSFGQIHWNNTRFGITGGGNYSRVAQAHNPSGPRYTVQFGGIVLIPIEKTHQFFIQPEVLYYGAGETGKDRDLKGKDGYDAVYGNNYLSVPVYLKGYFSEAESEFFGMAGPRFNFLLWQNVKNTPQNRPYYNPDVDDTANPSLNGKASGFNFGIGLGIGYSYKRQLELTLKYDIGLSDTYPGLSKEPGGSDKNKSEQVIAVTINYIFK
ncbi:PorT family protein [Chryseobacterium rhizoplanae]|uniref:porin family protein n=1 Tax=Chryseobacterium rhizoplanae TaxID=1609531 RepID=UPI001CE28DDB|nr:porin family protein [Chryseobacterium rhizoplanae]UCA61710.1 PorT family protein [Chryseobacterium rhizoplanae]